MKLLESHMTSNLFSADNAQCKQQTQWSILIKRNFRKQTPLTALTQLSDRDVEFDREQQQLWTSTYPVHVLYSSFRM